MVLQARRVSSSCLPKRSLGFTLLELMCALVVVGILATLAVPMAGNFRARAQGLQCVNNLKGLGAGAAAYMNEHENRWPQIGRPDSGGQNPLAEQQDDVTATRWIEALAAYGVGEKTWRCPTIEGRVKTNGKAAATQRKRIDYVPTQFDKEPGSAIQWPSHPWFIERTPSHGLGPKLLLADGRVVAMEDLLKELPVAPR
jgi:prepilin-type N-terminal cleavage/methylation domain-containing protein